jgi:hypothetical protein
MAGGMSNAARLLAIPCILLALFLVGAPAFPALDRAISQAFGPVAPAVSPTAALTSPRAEEVALQDQVGIDRVTPRSSGSRGALLPLYVSFAALQVLDAQTTIAALDRGATEANPLMRGIAGNRAALFAVKAGTTAGAIYLAERLRTHSRVSAVLLMAGFNSLYATVVAHNSRVLHQGHR